MAARHVIDAELVADQDQACWTSLHDELNGLPESFRAPLVLCYLEGLTQEQAAAQLHCPLGTIQSRLARGRAKLKARLTQKGVDFSTALGGVGQFATQPTAPPLAWADATVPPGDAIHAVQRLRCRGCRRGDGSGKRGLEEHGSHQAEDGRGNVSLRRRHGLGSGSLDQTRAGNGWPPRRDQGHGPTRGQSQIYLRNRLRPSLQSLHGRFGEQFAMSRAVRWPRRGSAQKSHAITTIGRSSKARSYPRMQGALSRSARKDRSRRSACQVLRAAGSDWEVATGRSGRHPAVRLVTRRRPLRANRPRPEGDRDRACEGRNGVRDPNKAFSVDEFP